MNRLTKSVLGSTTVAGLAALAPLSVDAGAAARGEAALRVNSACAQGARCVPAPGYICYTEYGYMLNYRCEGCGS